MKWNKRLFLVLFLLTVLNAAFAQNSLENFLKPSDTLNMQRRNAVLISETVLATGTLVGLNQLWYADYPKSDFHFINDNADWNQMDKLGHVFSSYHLGSIGKDALQWSGESRKNQLIYGATLGFVFLSAVEVFDGYSSEWGASMGDVIANASGTALFVSQELLWNEQRIVPKFSFHTTRYASLRPEVLGSSLNEQILKDYNGQTYWLSANMASFFKASKIPKWLNVAVGYGAEGMINGHEESANNPSIPNPKRFRQYYLSLDVDLTRIETKSHLLKTVFSIFNNVKLPAPTVEFTQYNQLKWHFVYF
ncbi:DUF2279 domain-containing protein [Flavobacterium sp.]|uniref:DUF2279 domain-containing protein n=1 Tax=Flavobacterium sp. TaxID=239 RepID=UPI002B4AD1D4|nr:DUF2279 domain-containing protein [Flavobacterium sp.]HLF52727.1 DUF2279 domain-containing protein [Flavobacterium sp.]